MHGHAAEPVAQQAEEKSLNRQPVDLPKQCGAWRLTLGNVIL
jgi:hypothetical protein